MSKLFFGGMPTGVDVTKLREHFPDINEGDEFTHEEVSEVIGVEHASNRYRTVVDAWRRKLLGELGIELGSVPGVGFKCLNPRERIERSVDGFQVGTRKQLRSVRRSEMVRTADPVLIKKQELMRRYGAAIVHEANTMMREIEPPKPQQQMPRLVQR